MENQLIAEAQKIIDNSMVDFIALARDEKPNPVEFGKLERKLAEQLVAKISKETARDIQRNLQRTYGV